GADAPDGWLLGGDAGTLRYLLDGTLNDESIVVDAAFTGFAPDLAWMVRDDGALMTADPAANEFPAGTSDDGAERPLRAVAGDGDGAIAVGDGGLVVRGRQSDTFECDRP